MHFFPRCCDCAYERTETAYKRLIVSSFQKQRGTETGSTLCYIYTDGKLTRLNVQNSIKAYFRFTCSVWTEMHWKPDCLSGKINKIQFKALQTRLFFSHGIVPRSYTDPDVHYEWLQCILEVGGALTPQSRRDPRVPKSDTFINTLQTITPPLVNLNCIT